jgi:hypothetical protein
MIFVLRNHCPMLVVNVIFHGCDSMLQIVSDESLSKPSGRAKTMALFDGVANHTPQGLTWPHHDFFKMIIHNKKRPHINNAMMHKLNFFIYLQLLELHFPNSFFFSNNNLLSSFKTLWHRFDLKSLLLFRMFFHHIKHQYP